MDHTWNGRGDPFRVSAYRQGRLFGRMAGENNSGSGKHDKRRKTGTDRLYRGRWQYSVRRCQRHDDFSWNPGLGQIRLTFREPVTGPATAEWYNSPSEDDKFDRFRRQEGYIMPGKDKAKINLSGKDNGNLRLNIHGNFRLGSIEVAERISVKALSFGIILGHFNWLRLSFLVRQASVCSKKKGNRQKQKHGMSPKRKNAAFIWMGSGSWPQF